MFSQMIAKRLGDSPALQLNTVRAETSIYVSKFSTWYSLRCLPFNYFQDTVSKEHFKKSLYVYLSSQIRGTLVPKTSQQFDVECPKI